MHNCMHVDTMHPSLSHTLLLSGSRCSHNAEVRICDVISTAFHCLSLPFLDLPLSSHCLSLPFLDLPLSSHCLSLPWHVYAVGHLRGEECESREI